VGQLASVIAQSLVYAGLIRLLVVDTGALSWAAMGIRRFDTQALAELAGGAAWVVVVIPATSLLAALLVAIFGVTPTSPLPPTGETSGFILQLIAGAVVAPLGEELLFRGFATTAWVHAVGYRSGLVRAALWACLPEVGSGSLSSASVRALSYSAFASFELFFFSRVRPLPV
jgi:membrane protease YdiL (CAAX protease family)